jgi:hypothetical protein
MSLSDAVTQLWNERSEIIFERIKPRGSILSWFGRMGGCLLRTTERSFFDPSTETPIRSVVEVSFTFDRRRLARGELLFRIDEQN